MKIRHLYKAPEENRQLLYKEDSRCAGKRQEVGSFLVEAMVSVLVSSLIALALGNMYMQVRRVSNMSQGQLIATALAQECVDHLRVMNFAAVSAATPSTHYASLYSANGDALFPRALLQDPALDYTNGNNDMVRNAQASAFHTLNPDTRANDDTIKIELLAVPGNCIQVIVTINWRDTSSAVKTYSLRSVVSQNGLGS